MSEIPDYPSNSDKLKEKKVQNSNDLKNKKVQKTDKSNGKKDLSEKKVEKTIKGKAKVKKKSEAKKFADVFISEDIQNVKSYIVLDVLIPAVKKAISDIVSTGIDMILYGGESAKANKSTSSRISYRSYYDNPRNNDRNIRNSSRTLSGYSYDDVILDNRSEVDEVLERMDELIATYGIVSVADLYDLVGITCNYTDNKYGWTNIKNASVVRVREGYLLKMPKAAPLDY
jgi:hypothetical protein